MWITRDGLDREIRTAAINFCHSKSLADGDLIFSRRIRAAMRGNFLAIVIAANLAFSRSSIF
jgi:hypothetical protein